MTAGLQVFNDTGVFQIDELYRNFVMRSKTVYGSGGDHTITHSNGVNPTVAFRSAASPGMYLKSASISGTTWTFVVNGIGTAYVFDVPAAPSTHGQGLQVFDAAGAIAFDSGYDYMKPRYTSQWQPLFSIAESTFPENGTLVPEQGGSSPLTRDAGETWAYAIFQPGEWLWYDKNGDGDTRFGQWGVFTSGDNFKAHQIEHGGGASGTYSSGYLCTLFVDVTGFA